MLNRKIEGESIIFTDGQEHILTITEQETENGILMCLSGQLRSDVAHDVYDELVALTTVGANIVVDFKEVTYIAPTLQNTLLIVQQKMDSMGKGTLLLRGMSKEIYREFEKSGEADLLMIEV